MTNRTKAIVGLGSVFLIGSLCGALIVGMVVRHHVKEAETFREREGFLHFFERQLDLSEAQRDSLNDELRYVYERLHELRESTAEQYSALLDTFRQNVYPKLRPDQRDLFSYQEDRLRRSLPHTGPRGMRPPGGKPRVIPLPYEMPGNAPPNIPREVVRPADTATTPSLKRPSASNAPPSSAREGPIPPDAPNLEQDTAGYPNPLSKDGGFEKHLGKLRTRLSLTDEQVTAIRTIVEEAKGRLQSMESEYASEPGRLRHIRKRIGSETRHKIFMTLTQDQREKLKEIIRKKHGRKPVNPE